MSIVYVTHEPLRRDEDTGEMVRAVDLSPAEEWGELRFLLPPGAPPLDPEAVLPQLRAGLAEFRVSDFLLPVGHPVLIAWAAALACRAAGGHLRLLQWRARERRYSAVSASVWAPDLRRPVVGL
jgi:hypothetical protein